MGEQWEGNRWDRRCKGTSFWTCWVWKAHGKLDGWSKLQMIKKVKSLDRGLGWKWRFADHEYLRVDEVTQEECVEYVNTGQRQEYAKRF